MPYSDQSRNSAFSTMPQSFANLADDPDYNHLAGGVNATLV